MILSKWIIGDLISVSYNGRLYDGCYIRKETDKIDMHNVAVLDNSYKGFQILKVHEKQIGSPVIGYHKDKPVEGYEGEF
jgi:uncharacterized membrane protein